MIKTEICKGDKVELIAGFGRNYEDEKSKKPVQCTVIKVDRVKGYALLEMPRQKAKRGEQDKPRKGVEVWKTVRYNPKSGEAGGLKILKRPVHISNLKVVEKAPKRQYGEKA
jgi:ribosomal protein L24